MNEHLRGMQELLPQIAAPVHATLFYQHICSLWTAHLLSVDTENPSTWSVLAVFAQPEPG